MRALRWMLALALLLPTRAFGQQAQSDHLYSVVSYADPATAAFVVIPALLLAILMWGTAVALNRSASIAIGTAIAAWMALTWIVADSGVLRDWSAFPPRIGLLVMGIVAISCAIAFSALGRALTSRVPLWALIAVQSFRLPLELAMHTMFERGVMPEQMTYTGFNFDILTGITAIGVGLALRARVGGHRLALVWNLAGLALLINVVTIAIVSTPMFAWFGQERLNVWVTYPPYVWLPSVMVTAALTGHLLVFRALLQIFFLAERSRVGTRKRACHLQGVFGDDEDRRGVGRLRTLGRCEHGT